MIEVIGFWGIKRVNRMTANRATKTPAAISSKAVSDNVRRRAATILELLPAAAEVSADRVPPAREGPASQIDARDSFAVTALADIIDRSLHAAVARFTAGLSPAALAHAYLDWVTHLTYSPGKRLQLVDKAASGFGDEFLAVPCVVTCM
jgi:poly(hydroxyalkanoate) polymerase-like protein